MINQQSLSGKNIVLAITGSIAAYKSVLLLRLLIKGGAEVKVIMTPSSENFVNKLTFSTLSKNPVHSEISDGNDWNNHVELGLWADAMIIAPLTANTLAKMANGIADTMVQAVYLSAKCPVFFAPAMDLDMWAHPSTQNNIKTVKSFGNIECEVGHGELASGLIGEGRMAEPSQIIETLNDYFVESSSLRGKRVLITGGPTQEKIDPVRFISNHSSGRMGIEIANAFCRKGATVHFVHGPLSSRATLDAKIKTIAVESAQEMFDECNSLLKNVDIIIMAAAVADYTPNNTSDKKIKKKPGDMMIELKRTKDIAETLGAKKSDDQIMIGFALETNNEIANAKAKIKKKNFDFIVLNSLNDEGAGFKHSTNKVTIIHKSGQSKDYKLKDKSEVAKDILIEIEKLLG